MPQISDTGTPKIALGTNQTSGATAAKPHAGAASHNVRLARKTQSLDVLYAVATCLSQPGSLEQLLNNFLDTFSELIDARAASVRLVTADGSTRLIASRGLVPEGIERDRQEFVEVPLQYQDRILGVYNLLLAHPLAVMGEDMQDLLISVGRHLGLAVEKARLDNDARRLAIMEERNMLGSELHDSLAQDIVGMRLQVKMLGESLARKDLSTAENEVRGLRQSVEQAHINLRNLLANFRLKIDERGLAAAITGSIERFRNETGIAVLFQNECRTLALSPAQEVHVFYIIQEALTNIRKHSSARHVRVMLNSEDDFYTVLIEDDGRGMAGSTTGMPGESMGLTIMRERTERLPGQLVIESEADEGTRIVLMFTASSPIQDG